MAHFLHGLPYHQPHFHFISYRCIDMLVAIQPNSATYCTTFLGLIFFEDGVDVAVGVWLGTRGAVWVLVAKVNEGYVDLLAWFHLRSCKVVSQSSLVTT